MYATNPAEFIEEKGFLAWLHYLVFPIDLIISGDNTWLEWRETRFYEVTPILSWLIPLLVIFSSTTPLSDLGTTLLFLFEVFVLTGVSAIYLAVWKPGCLLELAINYSLSFIIVGFMMFLAAFFWEILIFIGIAFLFGYVKEHFSDGYGYDDDED